MQWTASLARPLHLNQTFNSLHSFLHIVSIGLKVFEVAVKVLKSFLLELESAYKSFIVVLLLVGEPASWKFSLAGF